MQLSIITRTAGLLALLLPACGDGDATAVRVDLHYNSQWGLTRLQLDVAEHTSSIAPVPTVELLVSDQLAGAPLSVQVIGFRGDELVASGSVQVTPIRHESVTTTITLTCGAGCTPGDLRCSNDALQTCELQPSDGCTEWSAAEPCPTTAPYCSLGACITECSDECTLGMTQCAGPDEYQTCGEDDSDSCTDWTQPVACADGDTCTNGTCSSSCNECPYEGAVDCQGNGIISCGDYNADDCLEWSAPDPCDSGTTCAGGTCNANNSLTVVLAGAGTGTVISNPAGIACPGDCDETFTAGAGVTLTAGASAGSSFIGWAGGGCDGTAPCTLIAGDTTVVTATFELQQHQLTVSKSGTGTGTVTSNPAGINCGPTCAASYELGSSVTLTAEPTSDSEFTGWSGAGCSGTGACSVTMDAAAAVTASFTQHAPVTVTLSHSNSTSIVAYNAFGCTDNPDSPSYHKDSHYYRAFQLADFGITGPLTVSNVRIGVESARAGSGSSQPATMKLHLLTGEMALANLTELASIPITVQDTAPVTLNISANNTVVPAGSTLVVEFFTPSGAAANNLIWAGTNSDGETGPTYFYAAECGVPDIYPTAAFSVFNAQWVLSVHGSYIP